MVDIMGFQNAGRFRNDILPGDDPVNDRLGPGGLARSAFRLLFGDRQNPEENPGLVGRIATGVNSPEGLLGAQLLSGTPFGEAALNVAGIRDRRAQQQLLADRNTALDALSERQFQALQANRDAQLRLAQQQQAALEQNRNIQAQVAQQNQAIREREAEIKEATEARQVEKTERETRERRTRAESALKGLDSRNQLVLDTIDEAIELSRGGTTAIRGQLTKGVGGTDSRKLKGALDTIKANIGFGELQRLRDASPTGGAVGQLSDPERQALEATLGALDQALSEEDLDAVLMRLKDEITSGRQLRRDAFLADFGFDPFEGQEAALREAASDPGLEPPAVEFQEGQTATNPQTGERMIFRNGEWVKL